MLLLPISTEVWKQGAVTALVFVVGVLRKSYWALAMPVIVGFLGALYVAFWIGRALITTPLEPPSQE